MSLRLPRCRVLFDESIDVLYQNQRSWLGDSLQISEELCANISLEATPEDDRLGMQTLQKLHSQSNNFNPHRSLSLSSYGARLLVLRVTGLECKEQLRVLSHESEQNLLIEQRHKKVISGVIFDGKTWAVHGAVEQRLKTCRPGWFDKTVPAQMMWSQKTKLSETALDWSNIRDKLVWPLESWTDQRRNEVPQRISEMYFC